MPLVTIEVIEGVFTPAQRQELIREVTDAMLRVEGEAMRPYTWVRVCEVCKANEWGIGGKGIGPAEVHAIQAGRAPA